MPGAGGEHEKIRRVDIPDMRIVAILISCVFAGAGLAEATIWFFDRRYRGLFGFRK